MPSLRDHLYREIAEAFGGEAHTPFGRGSAAMDNLVARTKELIDSEVKAALARQQYGTKAPKPRYPSDPWAG